MPFKLHSDLERDGIPVGRFQLCHVLLINDSNYPWFVLVPEREQIRDTIDLSEEDHQLLWIESKIFGAGIMRAFSGHKLNIAALGNVTPQLHVHHVVRFPDDAAWPGPIWGKPVVPYRDDDITSIRQKLAKLNMEAFELA